MKAIFQSLWPYQKDAMNLPVANVETAIPFYETVMGFQIISRNDTPHKSAVLARDEIQIGLAENGGDPTQELWNNFRIDAKLLGTSAHFHSR